MAILKLMHLLTESDNPAKQFESKLNKALQSAARNIESTWNSEKSKLKKEILAKTQSLVGSKIAYQGKEYLINLVMHPNDIKLVDGYRLSVDAKLSDLDGYTRGNPIIEIMRISVMYSGEGIVKTRLEIF